MNELNRFRPSRFAVYSILAGIFNLSYAIFVATDMYLKGEIAFHYLTDSLPSGGDHLFLGVLILFTIFLLIPGLGHLIGCILGLLGVLEQRTDKRYGFVGLALNMVIPLLLFSAWIYIIIGMPGWRYVTH